MIISFDSGWRKKSETTHIYSSSFWSGTKNHFITFCLLCIHTRDYLKITITDFSSMGMIVEYAHRNQLGWLWGLSGIQKATRYPNYQLVFHGPVLT